MLRAAKMTIGLALAMLLTQPICAQPALPRPDHVVLVVMENHGPSILGRNASFITTLSSQGALFSNSFAITHPSEPNYFALFAGSTEGVEDNGKYNFDVPTLAGALATAGLSFVGYAERGSPRKHNPWVSFRDANSLGRDFADFPSDYAKLPTVSFVVPNLDNDMHDGSVADGDAWLKKNLADYAAWAKSHNSLLIVTFDEDEGERHSDNRIPTVIYGDHIRPGIYDQKISHYSILRTVLAFYGLPGLANAKNELPISAIWSAGGILGGAAAPVGLR